jgi:predicted membrane protein
MVTCLALSLCGIALAGLARARALRGILLALFGAALTIAWGISIGMVAGVAFQPQELRSTDGQIAFGVYVMVALLVAGIAAVIAMARFSHEEENRSTPLRILSLFLPLLATVWALWLFKMPHMGHEPSWGLQLVAAHPLLLMWIFFLTEPEGLGRRARKFAAERPRLATLGLPLLPGGGRGVLLFLWHALLSLGSVVACNLWWGSTRMELTESFAITAWFYAFCFAYIGVPTGLASRLWKSDNARLFLRVLLVIGWPLLIFLPTLFGLIVGIAEWENWEHPFNPYWVVAQLANGSSGRSLFLVFLVVLLLDGLALVLNARRIRDGIRELLDARARRAAPVPVQVSEPPA